MLGRVLGSVRRAAYRRRRVRLWTAAYCCAFDDHDAADTGPDHRV